MLSTRLIKLIGGLPHRNTMPHLSALSIVVMSLALSACGGGSGGDDDDPKVRSVVTKATIQGMAASGEPIAGATVTALCADKTGFLNVVITDDNGMFSGEVDANALPCALQVTEASTDLTFYSIAFESGITNITLLTDLIIAYYSQLQPADWYASDFSTTDLTDLNAAMVELLNYLAGIGYDLLDEDYDAFHQMLNPGDGTFYVLYQLQTAVEEDPYLADYIAFITWILNFGLNDLPTIAPIKSEPITAENRTGTWQVCDYKSSGYEMFEVTYEADGSWTTRIYELPTNECSHTDEDVPYDVYSGTEIVGNLVTLESGATAYELTWDYFHNDKDITCYSLMAIQGDYMVWGRRTDTYDCNSLETRPIELYTSLPFRRLK